MKKTLLKSMLAGAVMFGLATSAFAGDIPGAKDAKKGDIGRHESTSDVNEWLTPENGVYGLHTFAADANDWDSQFFIVIADQLLSKGISVEVKFEYRTDGEGAVKFNAQGHADPHAYVNNDGWATIEDATNEWKEFSTSFETTGEIRTLAVNASIARENGTLYLRNIEILVDNDEAVVTKQTDADAAEMEAAPEIKEPEPMSETDFAKFYAAVDTTPENVAKAYFTARNSSYLEGKKYVPQTVKFDGEDVFAFAVDSTCPNPWSVQFFATWTLEQVSASTVSPTEVSINFDYWFDWEAGTSGNFCQDDMLGGPQAGRWGVLGLAKGADGKVALFKDGKANWVHYADTIKNDKKNWELHLGANSPKFNYSFFLKNVEVKLGDKVVASMKDYKAVDGVEVKILGGGTAVKEVAAVNAYVAGDVLYASEAADVVIYNISGVAVKAAKNVTTLNVADLKAGLYIAKVGNKAFKFVK